MATDPASGDASIGLGLVFSILAVGGALGTAAFGYQSAMAHGGDAGSAQLLSGVAFGAAILAGLLAIVAIHVYAN